MSAINLTALELALLNEAIPYAREIKASEARYPTQEEYKRKLHCASASAKNLQKYIQDHGLSKLADQALNRQDKAADRAIVQTATAELESPEHYLLRENARLSKAIAKLKLEKDTRSAARHQQIHEELAELKELGRIQAKAPAKIKRSTVLSGNMLEVNIPDTHFGKLAWGAETGYDPYDTKIAQAMYVRAVDTLIERAQGYKYDEIVYVIGNDILHTNDSENKTAHGTIVTADGRYHKTFWKVRSTIVETIEKLRTLAPVRVITVFGNHDTLSAWHLGDSLECYFHKYDDVTISNSPTYRKYYEFGKVMLMLTHGDKGRREDYPLLMATEQPEMWARTKHREAHTGHLHTTKTQEFHGVRVRILSALCPPDDWHAENGYVGNLRNAESYIWNKNEGLIGTIVYNDDSQESLITKREIV